MLKAVRRVTIAVAHSKAIGDMKNKKRRQNGAANATVVTNLSLDRFRLQNKGRNLPKGTFISL